MKSQKLFSLMMILAIIPLTIFGQQSDQIGIHISHVEAQTLDFPNRYYNVTVEWENAWRNEKNHDAAWVFLKSIDVSGYTHIPILPGSEQMLWKADEEMPDATINVADDGRGMFIYASDNYRGELKYRVQVKIDTSAVNIRDLTRDTEAYGIEMVYIPEGGFTLGDPDTTALNYYGFYQSGPDGSYHGLYEIESEDETIPVGTDEGDLYYRSNSAQYRGDQQGPIPASFPKGVDPFYIMKYEVSQGDYVAFLNTLTAQNASIRYPAGAKDYRALGGTIRVADGEFVADRPDQRMMYWHWDDMMAYADWAALRPFTELEYTKAARGPLDPVPGEYAWNTGSLDQMARRIDSRDQVMKMNRDLSLSDLSDESRDIFGASYYWVFDLNGSVWEKVITVGDTVGRSFVGNHGDGNISYYGFADVDGWPSGYRDSEGGYGYRGGGFYGYNAISITNPYPPIAFRPYAAWSGGPRNSAYGFRGARTAD
ncbi:MAG: SUMF1/EgtB/PvdO family nonheme iron enzyme [Bacteroidetes bacterium]|nr:SUMF1/EgtB/PvdO family nonheme iron enzyme [Bacteroidota bacterium]